MYFKSNHIAAGFVAVLVGYTSSVAIVLQAAQAVGANAAQQNSWLLVLGIGMGLTSFGFSIAYKQPILTAWSTLGAALLATNQDDISLAAAIGAFLFSAVLVLLSGISGYFERVMDKLPVSLGAAMLAGGLLQFGLNIFTSIEAEPLLVSLLLLSWLIGYLLWPRYNIPIVLLVAIVVSYFGGQLDFKELSLELAAPVGIWPELHFNHLVGIGLPLFVVTMASQNLPGIATLQLAGYRPRVSALVSWTGITTLFLAPFGGFAFNLAAITAAICAGEDSDINPKLSYKSALVVALFYTFMGIFGATVVTLFALSPHELVLSIAGLALIGTIGNSLHTALAAPKTRDAALITFLVTFSGISPFGIGSPFWGLCAGGLVMMSAYLRAAKA